MLKKLSTLLGVVGLSVFLSGAVNAAINREAASALVGTYQATGCQNGRFSFVLNMNAQGGLLFKVKDYKKTILSGNVQTSYSDDPQNPGILLKMKQIEAFIPDGNDIFMYVLNKGTSPRKFHHFIQCDDEILVFPIMSW